MIDIHCHILPGLDDGAADRDEALNMCRLAVEDGIKTIVATPHQLDGLYDVTVPQINEAVTDLRQLLRQHNIPLEILPGGEVCVNPQLPDFFKEKQIMAIAGDTPYLLLEMPHEVIPRGLKDFLFNLQLQGIKPIISHPERNFEVQNDLTIMSEVVAMGNVLQVTSGSFTGVFGEKAEECVFKLLERKLVHVVASDAHSSERRLPVLSKARKIIADELGDDEAEEFFSTRPQQIVHGEDVYLPEPKTKRFGSRWKRILRGKK